MVFQLLSYIYIFCFQRQNWRFSFYNAVCEHFEKVRFTRLSRTFRGFHSYLSWTTAVPLAVRFMPYVFFESELLVFVRTFRGQLSDPKTRNAHIMQIYGSLNQGGSFEIYVDLTRQTLKRCIFNSFRKHFQKLLIILLFWAKCT